MWIQFPFNYDYLTFSNDILILQYEFSFQVTSTVTGMMLRDICSQPLDINMFNDLK